MSDCEAAEENASQQLILAGCPTLYANTNVIMLLHMLSFSIISDFAISTPRTLCNEVTL